MINRRNSTVYYISSWIGISDSSISQFRRLRFQKKDTISHPYSRLEMKCQIILEHVRPRGHGFLEASPLTIPVAMICATRTGSGR